MSCPIGASVHIKLRLCKTDDRDLRNIGKMRSPCDLNREEDSRAYGVDIRH